MSFLTVFHRDAIAVHIFEILGMFEKFAIPMETFKHFVFNVKKNYENNPFHKFDLCRFRWPVVLVVPFVL
jgi:hypothetical protein